MTIYVRLDTVETEQIDEIYFRVKQDVRLSKLNLPNVWRLLLQQANNLLEGWLHEHRYWSLFNCFTIKLKHVLDELF